MGIAQHFYRVNQYKKLGRTEVVDSQINTMYWQRLNVVFVKGIPASQNNQISL